MKVYKLPGLGLAGIVDYNITDHSNIWLPAILINVVLAVNIRTADDAESTPHSVK